MKRFFLLVVLVACGSGTTTDNDAGNGDAGNDVVSNDSSPSDAVATDSSSNDSAAGDGGLVQGQLCDPQNNQCRPTLLCCSEPTHMPDAATGYFCETPDNTNQCPKLP
jgi:hypothetical protein